MLWGRSFEDMYSGCHACRLEAKGQGARVFDYHVHSTYSVDCVVPMEMSCRAAIAAGVTEIAFTDHLDHEPADPGSGYYRPDDYLRELDENRSRFAGELTVRLVDDAAIRTLNRDWRGHDTPTNVLSFPAPEAAPGPIVYLGDIALSHETAAREAAAEGKSLADHVAHLAIHGFLHLIGYDHDRDARAEVMEGLERAILARLGIADPYIARDARG